MTTTTTDTTGETAEQPPLQERLEQAARASDPTGPASYMVLRREDSSQGVIYWIPEHDEPQEARDAAHAIRQAVERRHEASLDTAGEYVAVPQRSWKPTKVETEARTVLDIKGL
jgi:hypothetical protein